MLTIFLLTLAALILASLMPRRAKRYRFKQHSGRHYALTRIGTAAPPCTVYLPSRERYVLSRDSVLTRIS